jgi:hypothetical protein
MKSLSILAGFVILASCNQQRSTKTEAQHFESVPYQNRAFILTDSIRIYNPDLTYKTTVHSIAHTLVTIDSISLTKHYTGSGDTTCELYNLIKIRSGKVNGWVYGKDVFEFTDKKKNVFVNVNRDTSFSLDGVNFQIFVLKNFGVGFEDEDGLTLCGENNPVAVYNSRYKRLELIPVTDTGATYGNAYISLDNFDGWMDSIGSIQLSGDDLQIGIERIYQEGKAHFDILVHLGKEGSRAIVTRAKENVVHD